MTNSARASVCSSSQLIKSIESLNCVSLSSLGEQMALEAVTEFCDLQQLTGPQFDSLCAVNDRAKHGGNGGTLLIGGVL